MNTHLAKWVRAVGVLCDHEGVVASLEHGLKVVHVHHRHYHVRQGRGVDAVIHPHPQRKLREQSLARYYLLYAMYTL